MPVLPLLGDEAVAQAALDSGLTGMYAYPGTPSTEIMEYIQRSPLAEERNVHRKWSANEKTAVEEALGVSYTGKRAMAAMKHVGLNVAADPFINSAITGVIGGLVITVADDPSMHSSQNEQDSRFYGKFAMIPMFEPSNQQEAYDMTRYAFDLSEKVGLPVLMRLVTRLAHSRAAVRTVDTPRPQNELRLPEDPKRFVLLPVVARERYKILLGTQAQLMRESENSPFNKYIEGEDKSLGIITSGVAYNYLIENFPGGKVPYPVVKVGQYPVPYKLVQRLFDEVEQVMVIEEGYPFIEEQLVGLLGNPKVKGRFTGDIPRYGELNPTIVAKALNLPAGAVYDIPDVVVGRPPQLCPGCGHIDVYVALNKVMKKYGPGHVFSDIGCYTLGALPPYNAINTCVDMGASITMAKGAADAGLHPAVAVIGDSTFTHSGMTGLLDAVIENTPITVIIMDNSMVAMTGGQDSHAANRLVQICQGLGVDPEHIRTITPLPRTRDQLAQMIEEEINYPGVSVIIPSRPCVTHTVSRKRKQRAQKTSTSN